MTLRSLAATAACVGALVLAQFSPSFADGMPDDDNFNPVPSVPAVPAPGVKAPPPVRANPKPAKTPAVAAPAVQPVTQPAAPAAPTPPEAPAVVTPAPAPAPSAPAATAPVVEPAPAPVTTPSPVSVQPAPPAPAPSATPATPKPAASASTSQKTIYEVLSVDVAVSKKNPASAVVTVKGTARTGGWTKVELRPLQTFAPEAGMRSFMLVGLPPSGFSAQVLTPVTATITIDPLPADVQTIRVLSETNEIAQNFR